MVNASVPDGYGDLLSDDSRSVLVLTTASTIENIALSPIWFVADLGTLFIATEPTSWKVRNIRRNPFVSGIVLDDGACQRFLSIRGEAVDRPDLDPVAIYDRIAKKYTGSPSEGSYELTVVAINPTRTLGFDFRDTPA